MNNFLNLQNRKCPVCSSKNFSNFYRNDNYSKIDTKGIIYRYKHILVICNYCNLVYSNPWLGYKNTNKIYSNSAIGAAFEESNKAKKHFKCFKSFFQKKNSFDKNTKILEIGTATGILLKNISTFYNLKKKNLDGIEPSKKLYEKLKNNNYFKIKNKFIDQMKVKNKYDLIIMDNVLEHIEEPMKALKKIKSLMNSSSKLYIAVPNIFKYKNNFRDPFGHSINYYENNMKYLFNSNGLKIIKLKKHYNYLNFIAVLDDQNKKLLFNFAKDRKIKFNKVIQFIKKSINHKQKLLNKFSNLEKNIKKNDLKVVLFGASNYALEFLTHTNLNKNILFLTDSNPIYHNKKRFGLNVIPPIKLKNKNFDKIIITSGVFFSEIKNFILKLGISKKKIIQL